MKAYRLRKNLKINKIESFGVATVMESLPSLIESWKRESPDKSFDSYILSSVQESEQLIKQKKNGLSFLKKRIMILFVKGSKQLLRLWEDSGKTETFDVFLSSRYTKTKNTLRCVCKI